MKYAKILILVLIVSFIGYKIYTEIPKSDIFNGVSSNSDTVKINQILHDIDELSNLDKIAQCTKKFKDIDYDIEKTEEFDKNDENNTSIKNELKTKLFAVYANHFIVLCDKFLVNNDWSNDNMNYMYQECLSIKSSNLLGSGETISGKIDMIIQAIDLRGEVKNHLKSIDDISIICKSFDDNFPDCSYIVDASNQKLNTLSNSNYFNNCSGLKNNLKNIPDIICNKNVEFLKNIISKSTHHYFSIVYQSDYYNSVYLIVKKKINNFSQIQYYNQTPNDIQIFTNYLNTQIDNVFEDASNYYTSSYHYCKYPQ